MTYHLWKARVVMPILSSLMAAEVAIFTTSDATSNEKVGIMAMWVSANPLTHDDVIKWKHFPRNWPFVREIHRSPVNFPHKGQWRGALMFSLIYVWINDWVNNREAGDLRRQHGHYDVIVMLLLQTHQFVTTMAIPTSIIIKSVVMGGSKWHHL